MLFFFKRVFFALACLAVLLVYSPPVFAQGVFIVPPQGAVVAGKETLFHLFIRDAVSRTCENRIMITLSTPNKRCEVQAVADADDAKTPGSSADQEFIKKKYRFILPENISGTIKLTIASINAGSVLFEAAPPAIAARNSQVALGEKESVFQPFLNNLSSYAPMYFLAGLDPGAEKSKFQISFKYKLFNQPFSSQEANTFVDGFHLAYTQTSFWDLKSDSKPFDDTSYKPELFYLIPKIDLNTPWIKAFGIQTGFQHESNGKDGSDSRSTNFAYVQPVLGFHLVDRYFMAVAPRFWIYVDNDNETNQGLYKYRGYFNLLVKLGDPNGLSLETNTRWAEEGPSVQADLSYPLTSLFRDRLNLYLHFQYFNGYAERLIEYPKKEEVFRLGLSVTR